MHHWFLCLRDVMWLAIVLLPVFLASGSGYALRGKTQDEEDVGTGLFCLSFTLQIVLVVLFYNRVIQ